MRHKFTERPFDLYSRKPLSSIPILHVCIVFFAAVHTGEQQWTMTGLPAAVRTDALASTGGIFNDDIGKACRRTERILKLRILSARNIVEAVPQLNLNHILIRLKLRCYIISCV
ncbi:hypothetical protein D3C71_1854120 [compost metagenome]